VWKRWEGNTGEKREGNKCTIGIKEGRKEFWRKERRR
jgi:hypothetical protein